MALKHKGTTHQQYMHTHAQAFRPCNWPQQIRNPSYWRFRNLNTWPTRGHTQHKAGSSGLRWALLEARSRAFQRCAKHAYGPLRTLYGYSFTLPTQPHMRSQATPGIGIKVHGESTREERTQKNEMLALEDGRCFAARLWPSTHRHAHNPAPGQPATPHGPLPPLSTAPGTASKGRISPRCMAGRRASHRVVN